MGASVNGQKTAPPLLNGGLANAMCNGFKVWNKEEEKKHPQLWSITYWATKEGFHFMDENQMPFDNVFPMTFSQMFEMLSNMKEMAEQDSEVIWVDGSGNQVDIQNLPQLTTPVQEGFAEKSEPQGSGEEFSMIHVDYYYLKSSPDIIRVAYDRNQIFADITKGLPKITKQSSMMPNIQIPAYNAIFRWYCYWVAENYSLLDGYAYKDIDGNIVVDTQQNVFIDGNRFGTVPVYFPANAPTPVMDGDIQVGTVIRADVTDINLPVQWNEVLPNHSQYTIEDMSGTVLVVAKGFWWTESSPGFRLSDFLENNTKQDVIAQHGSDAVFFDWASELPGHAV
jgi:hypothetical protein